MRRSCGFGIAMVMLATALALPGTAFAFAVTGGAGTQTQNPYGMWYAGKEACAREGCHSQIASKPSPHSTMVTDVKSDPSRLEPAADSGLWSYVSPLGGIALRPRDIYLMIGDRNGFHEYAGSPGSSLATGVVPADDLPLWDPMKYLIGEGAWSAPTSKIANKTYGQGCAACHNVGVTRSADTTYVLASGATQTTATPTTVSEFGVQCESCHGSGKNPGAHKAGVPGVVGGTQILKAQVCGQCHVTGTTPQKNVAGAAFSNPNGYSTDTSLSAYLTPYTTVESETAFMDYVNKVPGAAKPKFLPNGDDYSMRHSYYNEWLVSSHGAAPRASTVSNSTGKCLRCHSGLGFLYRIDARTPSGTRVVPTQPTSGTVTSSDPGISCQVCHDGHVSYDASGAVDAARRWGNGKAVSCGDCHNWRYEMLDYTMQYETIDGVEYTRPPLNQRPHPAARELAAGGYGGEDGKSGLWGIKPMGAAMPGVTCKDCHMPRTYREDMPANDDGSNTETRMSHRFHIVEPGDAQRWKLRPNGDSCAQSCHKGDAADYTRSDMQVWMDQKVSSYTTASADASAALAYAAADAGFTRMRSFESAQPATGSAAVISAAKWAMLQHAAQNFEIITGEGSNGLHNPAYALAGLAKARLWAQSATATIDATIGAGPARGEGMTVSGRLLGLRGVVIDGAEVVVEWSTDGSAWTTVATITPNAATGAFSVPTGRIVGSRIYRARFSPSAGVDYLSTAMPVAVPVTTAGVLPAAAVSTWVDVASVQVTLTATPGALTMYSLAGATTRSPGIYTGAIGITAEGRTDVSFWSTDGSGVEATQTLPILIDRAAPTVHSDVAASYDTNAVVHVWGTDTGSGVASLDYAFKGVTHHVAGSSFTLTTSEKGKNSLEVTATDIAGKTRHGAVTVWVRGVPKLMMSPSHTRTITRGKRVRFVGEGSLAAEPGALRPTLTGQVLLLQRWSGRSWVTKARVRQDIAQASHSVTFSRRGTSRWRWHLVANERCRAASSLTVKVVVK